MPDLQTNGPFPNRLVLSCAPFAGPFTSPGLGAFDPRTDMEFYVDGDPLTVSEFTFDAGNNRYLLYAAQTFDTQGVVQGVFHVLTSPFASAGTLTALNTAGLGANVAASQPSETAWADPGNIAYNVPGTYASVAPPPSLSTPGIGAFEASVSNSGVAAGPVTITGSHASCYCIYVATAFNGVSLAPSGPGWTAIDNPSGIINISGKAVNGSVTATTAATGYASPWVALLLFFAGGGVPTPAQIQGIAGFSPTRVQAYSNPQVAGNINLVVLEGFSNNPSPAPTVIDSNNGSIYTLVGSVQYFESAGHYVYLQVFASTPINAGANTVTINLGSAAYNVNTGVMMEMPASVFGGPGYSEFLQAANFGLTAIPAGATVTGFEVIVSGKEFYGSSPGPAGATLLLELIPPLSGTSHSGWQLPQGDGSVTFGSPTDTWGLALTPELLNSPSFGFNLQASVTGGQLVTFDVCSVALVPTWVPPALTLGGLALVASYSPEGDEGLPASATLATVPAGPFAPGAPFALAWSTTGVAKVRITNPTASFDTGVVNSPSGQGSFAVPGGFATTQDLTMYCFDAAGDPVAVIPITTLTVTIT